MGDAAGGGEDEAELQNAPVARKLCVLECCEKCLIPAGTGTSSFIGGQTILRESESFAW